MFPPRPKERGFHTEYFDEPPSTIILYKCGCSSAVERQLPKLRVTGSIPVTRLNIDLKSRKIEENHGTKRTTNERRNPRR